MAQLINGQMVYQGGEALPSLPTAQPSGQSTTGMSQIQQGSLSAGASNPISSESLTPATPLSIPTVPLDTTANAVTGQAQASINQTTNMLNQAQADKQNAVNQSKNDLTDLQNEILGVQGQRAGLDKQAGLDTLNISIADLTNTLESSQKAQGEELKALNGSGLTDVQKAQQGREINRRYAIEQSDTLFALNQTQRRFDAASANIDRKIQLQLEPIQTKLKFSELFYADNKAAFSKAEDRAFQNLIDTNNKAYTEALANKNAIGDIQKVALANGINIPLSVLAKLNTAKDANEAYSILQQNGISLENPLDKQLKQAQLDNMNSQIAERNNNATGAGAVTDVKVSNEELANVFNGDPVAVIANAIKNSGAKQSQSTNDAINVISGLQELVKGAPDGVFVGVNPFLRRPNIFANPKQLTNRSNIEAVNLKVQQWASGAALTEQQTKQVGKVTPRVGDTDKQVRSKTNALANYMISQVSGQLAGQGVGFSMETVDMFAISKPVSAQSYLDSVELTLTNTTNAYSTAGYKF